ncbi:MAG: PD-(D/E)XK nuclease family protein [Elusimicrobia bacterium]|nr:PD-(D/E)XK nuclease family protein [Elusimicrobiota bacterium]
MRPLSHSSISMYTECPQKYKFRYIDKLPEKPKSFFSFGKSVHSALEYFYNIPALPAPTLEKVLKFYKDNWISEGYKDAEQERENLEEGERILRGFYKKHIDDFKLPFFAEYKFDLKVDGIPVIGFVDRIDKTDSGKLSILDYKTGKSLEKDRVLTDAQLTMYQMACEELLGMEVERLSFYHLNSLKEHVSKPHTKKQVKDLRQRVVTVAESIQKGLFEPQPEERKCQWCDFKPHCPVFRDHYGGAPSLFPETKAAAGPKRAAPALAEAAAAAPRSAATVQEPLLAPRPEADEELAALVDRLGSAVEEITRLQAEADQLQAAVADRLKEKGWSRAFGSAFEALMAIEDRWEFDDKTKVLDAIRRAGHWDDIQAPSGPLVQKLMKNPTLPPELRKKLESLGRRVERAVVRSKRSGAAPN